MPKTTKSVKTTVSKKSKASKKAKLEAKVAKTVPVVAPAVVVAPVAVAAPAPAPAPENETANVSQVDLLFKELVKHSDEMWKSQKRLTSNLKKVMKAHQKHCKELRKNASKSRKRVRDPNKPKRAPSGFAKPTVITNTLCDFLGQPHGTLMARTEVTKKVTAYIKTANLQVQTNKRRFIPDAKLGSILTELDGVKKDKNGKTDVEKGYTYFNLQKYLSAQFPKKVVKA
jgi:chromatin remodeling complex protein RSC6